MSIFLKNLPNNPGEGACVGLHADSRDCFSFEDEDRCVRNVSEPPPNYMASYFKNSFLHRYRFENLKSHMIRGASSYIRRSTILDTDSIVK
jgi:hypothetical protein